MKRYTDDISKLAILAKLPVPKKATLNKIICKAKRYNAHEHSLLK
jgi:hypothetical protein